MQLPQVRPQEPPTVTPAESAAERPYLQLQSDRPYTDTVRIYTWMIDIKAKHETIMDNPIVFSSPSQRCQNCWASSQRASVIQVLPNSFLISNDNISDN
ncbi:hypothetical protein J6590_062810 [Homalodisca vitripennis]|nr:hypothetical protein J6590_062810 [Homalodisca vitripennis]